MLLEPAYQTIDLEGKAPLNCMLEGHPIIDVTWYKDGYPLVTSDNVVMMNATSLEIQKVTREDRGMYQCIVSNDHQSKQASAQISLGCK